MVAKLQLPGGFLFASLQASQGHKPAAGAHAVSWLTQQRSQPVGGTTPEVLEALSSVLVTCKAGQ